MPATLQFKAQKPRYALDKSAFSKFKEPLKMTTRRPVTPDHKPVGIAQTGTGRSLKRKHDTFTNVVADSVPSPKQVFVIDEEDDNSLSDDDGDINYHSKSCHECSKGDREDEMLLCDRCDKGFHMGCLSPPLDSVPEGDWLCEPCMKVSKELDVKCCEICASPEDDENMLLCDKCNNGFHMYCLKPIVVSVPAGDWFCVDCSVTTDTAKNFADKKKSYASNQTKICDFFRIQAGPSSFETQGPSKIKRRRTGYHGTKSNRQCFRLPRPSEPSRRLMQMSSLASALEEKNIEYIQDLAYSAECPSSLNQACRDNGSDVEGGGVQPLTKTNLATFLRFKQMLREGLCPPTMVLFDPIQGFVVEADAPIPDRTLICEYVGEVQQLWQLRRDAVASDSDSLMDLLRTRPTKQSLVLNPDRKGNIARFLSGINNSSVVGRRAQNVRSARFCVDGQIRVILYAARDISRGERLMYDYNALQKNGYPTDHFV